jgi:hypothetical protein
MLLQKKTGDWAELQSQRARLDAIRNEREYLIDQIRLSERTIEHSRKLLKQLDTLLAKVGKTP